MIPSTPIPPDAHPGVIVTTSGVAIQGLSLDGKTVRGATKHGSPTHLVSLVEHGTATTLAHVAVEAKRNEITACSTLLDERDLTGVVVTTDAIHTQRAQAERILRQGGHFLMVVKKNQPRLYEERELFCRLPPIPADHEQWDRVQTVEKGHGRLEIRTLERGSGMDLDWPGASQLFRRTCERIEIRSGKRSMEVTYGISSIPASEVTVAQMEHLWRGHWTIENRKHSVRDVTMGEDACQMHTGHAPRVLATLRSAIIDIFRWQGWSRIPDAIRHYGASVKRQGNRMKGFL